MRKNVMHSIYVPRSKVKVTISWSNHVSSVTQKSTNLILQKDNALREGMPMFPHPSSGSHSQIVGQIVSPQTLKNYIHVSKFE